MTSKEYLQQHEIQATDERLKVVDYLMNHHTHPTADEVYNGMLSSGVVVSRATVFNTLKILVDRGAIRTLLIEDGVTRYDIVAQRHAHFRCLRCGKIYDMPIIRNASIDLPDGFKATGMEYFVMGICPECE